MTPISMGIFCESNTDSLILQALICRVLSKDTSEIQTSEILSRGGSFKSFCGAVPDVLRKLRKEDASVVVVCTDNDGKVDISKPNALPEDPKHPRHARHVGQVDENCRHCLLVKAVQDTLPRLGYPGRVDSAPTVIVTVPVEAIESWLLTARALAGGPDGKYLRAEDLPAGEKLKLALYGRPFVVTPDVESKAVPILNNTNLDLDQLAEYSPSFRLFLHALREARLI